MGSPNADRRALAYIALVCLLLLALDCWHSWTTRELKLREMATTSASRTAAAAQHTEDLLNLAAAVLLGIRQYIYENESKGELTVSGLQNLLRLRAASVPQINALLVYDAKGNRVATSIKAPLPATNASQREYFRYHSTQNNPELYISQPVVGPSSGVLVIQVTMRLNKPDGRFGGVVIVHLSVEQLRAYLETLNPEPSTSAVIFRDDSSLLISQPFDQNSLGKNTATLPMFAAYQDLALQGSLIYRTEDHVERYASYRHLDHYPVLVGVALSRSGVLAAWWEDTLLHTFAVTLLIAVVGFMGWRLISSRDALHRTLARLALHDSLTGLANRRCFDEDLAREFARAKRDGTPLSLILIDVDYFKNYNDTYGHLAGDECLRLVGGAIKAVAARRPGDLTARYGGEEIAVLLPNTEALGALTVAEKMLQAISDLQIAHAGNPASVVTISAGVHSLRPTAADVGPEPLVAAADRSLYIAKKQGRNRVYSTAEGIPEQFELDRAWQTG